MNNTAQIGIVVPLLSMGLLSLGLAGCNDGHSLTVPSAPSTISPPSSQPTVTSITPNTGSTRGEALGYIIGPQFQSGARVTLGSGGIDTAWVLPDGRIRYKTSASAAGRVDVTVTNPGGLSSTLPGAYTFAPPETFDSNGDWGGDTEEPGNFFVEFTIRQSMLVRVSCGGVVVTLASGSPVHNGAFSFLGDDGAALSGRLVSPIGATGTVNVGPCAGVTWWGEKGRVAQSSGPR